MQLCALLQAHLHSLERGQTKDLENSGEATSRQPSGGRFLAKSSIKEWHVWAILIVDFIRWDF